MFDATCARTVFALLALTLHAYLSSSFFPQRGGVRGDFPRPALARETSHSDVAIVVFGNVGGVSYEQLDEMKTGRTPWSAAAARTSAGSIRTHVIDANFPRWRADTFFHTWQTGLEGELRDAYTPVRAASGEGVLPSGERVASGLAASVELALAEMTAHVEGVRGGRPYDRVVLIRFDTIFYRRFSLEKLTGNSTVYFSSWCRAFGPPVVPLPDARFTQCNYLEPYWAAAEGVPDFWFAGGYEGILVAFRGFHSDLARGAFARAGIAPCPAYAQTVGGGCSGRTSPMHGHIWANFASKEERGLITLRRYGFHGIDHELVRDRQCGFKWAGDTREPPLPPFFHDLDDPVSDTRASDCGGGKYLCAWEASEIQHCGGWSAMQREEWSRTDYPNGHKWV